VLASLPPQKPRLNAIGQVSQNVFSIIQTNLTVQETIKLYGKDARSRLAPHFKRAKISYPPSKITFLSLKEERLLIVFAPDEKGKWKQITGYYVVGTSGKAGPKLKEGDLQIPEGYYKITGLYPNSIAHLGLRVNYPNSVDKLHARKEKRAKLGGDILIHGSYWSTGCLAMGNVAIEELYVLAHDVGCNNIELIFSPCNLLTDKPLVDFKKQPAWLPALYKDLTASLKTYPIKINPDWITSAEQKPTE
jgi:murein L,D-transpeptidase YafK